MKKINFCNAQSSLPLRGLLNSRLTGLSETLILLTCFLFSSVSAYADKTEKQYKKLIEKYDVADIVKSVENNHPVEFWINTILNNEALVQFSHDIQKTKGPMKKAKERTARLPRFYPKYDNSILDDWQGFCDTLLINMGITDLGYKCSLHVVYSDEVNAFAALTDDGFAMCVTTGLISRRGLTYDMLMGFVAHEFVHGAFCHHMRGIYAEEKESRKNNILGGIAMGLTGVAAGLDAYNAAAYGVSSGDYDYGAAMNNISNQIQISTMKYAYKFSREQEYEADLVAFRFLENMGRGDEYINGLRFLGTDYDFLYNDYSDHPTTISRIQFLLFAQQHPELGYKSKKQAE